VFAGTDAKVVGGDFQATDSVGDIFISIFLLTIVFAWIYGCREHLSLKETFQCAE
jgi:hypothetical protein